MCVGGNKIIQNRLETPFHSGHTVCQYLKALLYTTDIIVMPVAGCIKLHDKFLYYCTSCNNKWLRNENSTNSHRTRQWNLSKPVILEPNLNKQVPMELLAIPSLPICFGLLSIGGLDSLEFLTANHLLIMHDGCLVTGFAPRRYWTGCSDGPL